MSKAMYASSRGRKFDGSTANKLLKICNALVPDNIRSTPEHSICVKDHLAYAVTMKNSALHETDMSLLLGYSCDSQDAEWFKPKCSYPDGNYAIFRADDDCIEVLSDGAGSRTIWYWFDDDLFIASTSQRAIILFLGSFLFDERVIPWMLSTGTLGPQFSWDKRLQRLQADSAVLLDRNAWSVSVRQSSVVFTEVIRDTVHHKNLLLNAIQHSIASIKHLDFDHWLLPLSGGYDSRAILCFIKDQLGLPKGLTSVTWGLEESINEDGNDAMVAKTLAHSLGVRHDYFHTNISTEPIDSIVTRFILCSEGRIDHIAGYMDGMEIWRQFYDDGVTGIIRGDEGFGWAQVSSDLTVRLSVGCALCADYANLRNALSSYGLPSQQLPHEFVRHEEESLCGWRDRLYHSYRIPTILASLSDIKLSYIEQISPLTFKSILHCVRSMPDTLRTNKRAFKEIVTSISPACPIARKGANAIPTEILREKSFTDLLQSELLSTYASNLLGEEFVTHVSNGIAKANPLHRCKKHQIAELARSRLAPFFKNVLRDKVLRPNVDGNVLAFRVYIIIRMHKLLSEDASRFSRH